MPLDDSATPVADESATPAVDDLPAVADDSPAPAAIADSPAPAAVADSPAHDAAPPAAETPEPETHSAAAGPDTSTEAHPPEPDASTETDAPDAHTRAVDPDAGSEPDRSDDSTDPVSERTDREATTEVAPAPAHPDRVGPARRHVAVLSTVAAFVLAADEITKSIVVAHLDPANSPHILGGLFYFSLIRNSGAAWGIAGGATILFALISAIVAGAIIRVAGRLRSTPWAIALGLLLGGALGNLSDRIFRQPGFLRGRVVDFISVFAPDGRHFPIFNIADSAITTGAILLAIITVLGVGLDGSRKPIQPNSAR